MRSTSMTVNSRPSITVPIIGDTAAQAIEPMPYQASGVGPTPVVLTGGLKLADWAHTGAWTPRTITRIAAIAPRRIRIPQLGRKTGRAILHSGRGDAMRFSSIFT